MTGAMNQPHSPSISDEDAPGMSDEEELRRIERFHGIDGQGVGEVYVDLEQQARELGLIPEGK